MKQEKKSYLAVYVCLCFATAALAVAVVPVNVFCFGMPEWICIVLSLAVVAANIILWVRLRGMIFAKLAVSVLGAAAIVLSVIGSYCNPYWNSISFRNNYSYDTRDYDEVLTYEQAKKDLDCAMKYLKKLHPALYRGGLDGIPDGIPSAIEERYRRAVQNLQEMDTVDVNSLAQEIEGVFSLLGDAHTDIWLNYENRRFMKYIYEHNRKGDSFVGLNGFSLEELLEQNADKISYETVPWGIMYLTSHVSSVEGLAYLGISAEDGVTYTYETENGELVEQYAAYEDFLTYEEYAAYNGIEEETGGSESFVSYEIDPEHDLAVLTLTQCINDDEYRACVREMFTEVKERGIRNVAVDLRENGGGSSSVATEFLRYIDVDSYKEWADEWRLGWFLIKNEQSVLRNPKYEELLFDGNLYLLTSVSTFSSAMDFAEYVKDNELGVIVGEASGNAPDSYGDIAEFRLPESGIFMQISTKKWHRIDDREGLIEPDIACDSEKAMICLYDYIASEGAEGR